MLQPNNSTSRGIFKSTNEGASWSLKNSGLPMTLPRVNVLLPDPAKAAYLHAGASDGYYFSVNAAESWSAANAGLSGSPWINAIAMTGSRRLLAGLDGGGLFVLDLSIPAVAPSITTQPASQTIP